MAVELAKFNELNTAEASKKVRSLVEELLKSDEDGQHKIKVMKEYIEWAKKQNRIYLEQNLTVQFARLLNKLGKYTDAANLSTTLIHALKKIDDKELLVAIHLEESKSMYALKNFRKASTALVAARSLANAIYLAPKVQAALDMQSGILHVADEKDFKTAFSYFYEAFDNYNTAEDKEEARRALKYMCLTKIMLNETDIEQLLTSKAAVPYSGTSLNAMRDVAAAFKKRSLKSFMEAFEKYKKELQDDPVIKNQFLNLKEQMLEKEITRVIEPYRVVELDHISRQIGLPREKIEKKIGQMLLDKKILGRIDQSCGTLSVFREQVKAPVCQAVVEVIRALSETVDVSQDRGQEFRRAFVRTHVDKSVVPATPPQSPKPIVKNP